ncbi:MAG: hypothetical protein M3R08_12140 [Bacteroidota bacterium]|nr:hypothetical protein [Bacteroidota bacterium]
MLRSSFYLLLTIFLFFRSVAPATAQKYITAGGVRFETDRLGFTVKHRILPITTLEAIAMGSAREISGHLLAQQHFPLLGKRLNIYVGGGLHGGDHKDQGSYFGIDLITGIEYKVNALPLLLSFDFKPAIHINYEDWLTPSTAFSLRYVFVKEKKKEGGFFKGIFKKDGENEKNNKATDEQDE